MNNRLKHFKIIALSCLCLAVLLVIILTTKTTQAQTKTSFWQFTSIDTMKYSRDPSREKLHDPSYDQLIDAHVREIAEIGATHVAIATPYDEEFVPMVSRWVNPARKYHINVWFRGNFSSWEGWFGYKRFTDITEHHILTKQFITNHADLFQDGDIFTPCPECENGGPGDPRGSAEKSARFNQFLIDSYNNCTEAFASIHKQVTCGYFSTNGDIAKQVLTPDTVEKIGNTIVIDHYVSSPEKMSDDLDYFHNKFPNAKIVLGEFGAPIPDLNGTMNEEQQADFVDQLLQVFINTNQKYKG